MPCARYARDHAAARPAPDVLSIQFFPILSIQARLLDQQHHVQVSDSAARPEGREGREARGRGGGGRGAPVPDAEARAGRGGAHAVLRGEGGGRAEALRDRDSLGGSPGAASGRVCGGVAARRTSTSAALLPSPRYRACSTGRAAQRGASAWSWRQCEAAANERRACVCGDGVGRAYLVRSAEATLGALGAILGIEIKLPLCASLFRGTGPISCTFP